MTLHPHITTDELRDYCELCREFGDKCKRVRVEKPVYERIKNLTPYTSLEVRFYGNFIST